MIDLYYFGTDLTNKGHYIFKIEDDVLLNPKISFKDIPFNPELFFDQDKKGEVKYKKIGFYKICAICGSCVDTRPGSVSVFWTQDGIDFKEFKNLIESNKYSKKIIEKMAFKILW